MTKEDMEKLVNEARVSGNYKIRQEFEKVPEGLSLTKTEMSEFWRLRDGNKIAMLRAQIADIYFEEVTINGPTVQSSHVE